MCSLCGVLGGPGHWTESSSAPGAFTSRRDQVTHRRERQERTRVANRVLAHYGLKLADFSGSSYVLSNRTGRSLIVDNITEVWIAAEKMLGRECDPLDPALLADLAR
jgi:hypothetical protein